MTVPYFIDLELSSRLCLTLLHSLSQATLLALVAYAVGRMARRRSVERDYALQVAALLATLGAMPVTFALLVEGRPAAAEIVFAAPPVSSGRLLVASPRNPETKSAVPAPSGSSTEQPANLSVFSLPEVRDPFWMRVSPTQTDAAGLFTVYESGRFQLVVLHKAGFAVVNSEQIGYQPVILHPWVHIAGTIDRRDNLKQGIDMSATAKSSDGWPPIHLLDFDVPVAENGSFEDLYTPPGDVSVQRHVPGENGMSYLLAAQLIKDAKPGSLHRVTIGQLTADDYKRLNFVRNPHK